ncbi:MAG: hypothetical protein JO307_19635 [Bryobacterales bacterium]|nr:hypothetical protein [Bryobacterales bacterium]MBV9398462.1 hypothetical protein [Bryobacterales bacterium]
MKKFERSAWGCLINIAIVLLVGCRLSYHLQGQERMAILIPPVPPAALPDTPSVFVIRVSNARTRPAILDGCDINNDLLRLQWFGNTAAIQLTPDSYFPAPGDERSEEIAPRVYLDSVQRVEAFRDALEDRVVRGCLRSNEAQSLTRKIVENLPLPPLVAHFIRFGGGATGLVDLTSDFRLKVVSPMRSAHDTKEVVDYQIAYYRLTPAPKDARIQISLTSISTGQPTERQGGESAAAAPLVFPASFRFFRLLFRTDKSSADHLATILSADDEATLNKATRRFKREPDALCEIVSMPGVTCVTPAPDVAVNLEFPVSVNRKQVFVPLGGTLSDALQSRKRASEITATLRIRRLFHGRLRAVKFDPASQQILRFVLMPGDEISW